MAKSWSEIIDTVAIRRRQDAPFIRRLIHTRDHYNGDVTIPLIQVEGEPEANMLMPSLIHDGVEGTAMTAAGSAPTIHVPAIDENKDTGKRSIEYARIRRRALYARWHESRLSLTMRRAYRQQTAYGSMTMIVVPDAKGKGARIEFRDALGCYPEPRASSEIRLPTDVAFVYGRSPEWINSHYPVARPIVQDWMISHPAEALWDMVEWVDEDNIIIGLLGPRSLYLTSASTAPDWPFASGLELMREPNRAGVCTAVTYRRITLDRIAGQLEQIIPHQEWAAKLMALDFAAAERFVFPSTVVIGEQNTMPELVGGQWNDGRTGKINLFRNVRQVEELNTQPSPSTGQMLDRLERNARTTGGVNAMFGGEQPGATLRTGRAIDSLAGFSIDPRIQELQEIMGYALEEVNRAIIAVEKGYFARKQFTVFSGWAADRGQVSYSPEIHFETDDQVVAYAFPGADISQITTALAQTTGAGMQSRMSARQKHPLIDDPEEEHRQIIVERIEDAVLVAMQQGVASGQVDYREAALISREVKSGTPMEQAIEKATEQQQQRLAMQQQMMAQGQAGAAETQPGLATAGPSQPIPVQAPPSADEKNLALMTRALAAPGRSPQSGIPA